MRAHMTNDEEIKQYVKQGLKENDWYCPCVVGSKGKPEYKCMCEDFRINVVVGQPCHCGLYIKAEQ